MGAEKGRFEAGERAEIKACAGKSRAFYAKRVKVEGSELGIALTAGLFNDPTGVGVGHAKSVILDYPGLHLCYLLHGVSEVLRVVKADGGHDGDLALLDDVGGIVYAAHAHLKDHDVAPLLGKIRKSDKRHKLKLRHLILKLAEGGAQPGTVYWSLDEAGILTITGNGPMADWESVEQTPWFSELATLRAVVIVQGVTSVGTHAFSGAQTVESVELAESVEYIGAFAFFQCGGFGSVTIG